MGKQRLEDLVNTYDQFNTPDLLNGSTVQQGTKLEDLNTNVERPLSLELSEVEQLGKDRARSVKVFDENLVIPQGLKSDFDNWINSFQNSIDEIDVSRNKGKQIELNVELNNIKNQLEDPNLTREDFISLQERANELNNELFELEENVRANEEDIATSPTDPHYDINQRTALLEENSNIFDWLQFEAPKELGGTASEWGTQAALLAKDQIPKKAIKNLLSSAILEAFPGLGTAAHGIAAGILTAADISADLFALYKMRENETYSEMADAFEKRYGEMLQEYALERNVSPDQLSDRERRDIYNQAYEGLSEFKAKQMSLVAGDAMDRILIATPWSRLGKAITSTNKFVRAGATISGGITASAVEGGEEGAQYSFAQDYLAGKFSEDFSYLDAVLSGNKELLDATTYSIGLTDHRFEDDAEFRNSVRSGMILGGLMGGSSNIVKLGKDIYDYQSVKKNTNSSADKLLDLEQTAFKAERYADIISSGKNQFFKESILGLSTENTTGKI